MQQINDINVFPMNTPNQELTDAKQYLAAQRSLQMLEKEIKELSEDRGGYRALLQKRATECSLIIAKLEEKYKDS